MAESWLNLYLNLTRQSHSCIQKFSVSQHYWSMFMFVPISTPFPNSYPSISILSHYHLPTQPTSWPCGSQPFSASLQESTCVQSWGWPDCMVPWRSLPSEWCIKVWHKSKDAACNGKYHMQYGPALCILRIHVHIWTCDPPNAGLKNVIHKKVTPFAASMKQKIDVQGSEYLPVVANHPEGKVQEAKSLPSGV